MDGNYRNVVIAGLQNRSKFRGLERFTSKDWRDVVNAGVGSKDPDKTAVSADIGWENLRQESYGFGPIIFSWAITIQLLWSETSPMESFLLNRVRRLVTEARTAGLSKLYCHKAKKTAKHETRPRFILIHSVCIWRCKLKEATSVGAAILEHTHVIGNERPQLAAITYRFLSLSSSIIWIWILGPIH
jgi:hypothetical protein